MATNNWREIQRLTLISPRGTSWEGLGRHIWSFRYFFRCMFDLNIYKIRLDILDNKLTNIETHVDVVVFIKRKQPPFLVHEIPFN